jgi:hypothetical protein
MLTLMPGAFLLTSQLRADACRSAVSMNPVDSLFTVYEAGTAIVLRAGCYEHLPVRVICICQSYKVAQRLAQLAAKMNGLSIVDYVARSNMQRQR